MYNYKGVLMKITDKTIRKVLKHSISKEKMWWYWTTSQGVNSFFCEDSKISLEPFGPYEIYFSMDWPKDFRGSEGCQVLSYLPYKMFSFTWNAPPQFEAIRNASYKTWLVLEFEDQELILTHLGWPEGQVWDEVYDYFDKAWTYVLNKLQETIRSSEERS